MIVDLADRLQGVKEYYFVKKLEEIRKLVSEGHDVINFGIGSPDLVPPERAIEALVNTVKTDTSHGYQPYKGIPELRDAFVRWYKKTYRVDLDAPTEILPLMGSKEGILHVTLAFVNPGEEVLVPNPGYPTYTSLSNLLGANVRHYNLKDENDWYPDLEELEKQDLSKVKIMWVNYPHMPTGTPARLDVFEKLVAFAKEHSILLCHDNPYSLVLNKQQPLSIFNVEGAKDVAIELNSMSKSHNMAGWRIGVMTAKEDYINAALRVKSNIDSGMFKGIQAAAVHSLAEPTEWNDEKNRTYAERRELVYEILDHYKIDYNTEQEGMFVWAKPTVESGITDIDAFIDDLLYNKHIFITPGKIFGSNGEGFIRLSLCVPADRIAEALERIKKG